jgi:plastocyanin domain-containing protein
MKDRSMQRLILSAVMSMALISATAAWADDTAEIALKNHQFVPPTLTIPAGQQVKLTVKNEDATPAEFESHDFHVEKVVPGNGQIVLYVGPLEAGTYGFFDDFHEDTTKGKLVVK